ncbi:MAG: hypothetical protein HAW63_03275 [Bdellovibrionaceae bacterium]|nr:hypothetical protein [Pseudobdellovibrionaceae bacterium]
MLKNKIQIGYFLIAMILFFGIVYFNKNYSIPKKASETVLYPPKYMSLFSFGYSDYYADILWLRLIQDIDFCEKGKNKCSEGWAYKMLEAIVELSPKFRNAYSAGALTLSVLVNDRKGASKIFYKAIKEFPDDWEILYKAAYHFLLEDKNNVLAAQLLQRSAQHGGPSWLYSLAARLHKKEGALLLGIISLKNYLKTLKKPKNIKKVKKRLYLLEKQYRAVKNQKK